MIGQNLQKNPPVFLDRHPVPHLAASIASMQASTIKPENWFNLYNQYGANNNEYSSRVNGNFLLYRGYSNYYEYHEILGSI